MSITTHPSRVLGHHVTAASFTADGTTAGGPFPAMSARAALIARGLGVALLVSAVTAIDSRLLVVLAFGLAFWIAAELEVLRLRRAISSPVRCAEVLPFRKPEGRPSGPSHHPKAA